MRDDATGNAGGRGNLVQIGAELADEHLSGSGACQEMAVRRGRIQPAEETQTMDQIAREGVDRYHALGFQLAERHVKGPVIGIGSVETIEGEIDGFADAHACVAEQQKEVGTQIIAALQLLLEQLIVFRRQGARQVAGTTGNILATEQLA